MRIPKFNNILRFMSNKKFMIQKLRFVVCLDTYFVSQADILGMKINKGIPKRKLMKSNEN